MKERFIHKSIVVTGAGAGMGRQIARQFLEEGAAVVAVDLSKEALSGLQQETKETADGRLITYVGDISQREVNEHMIELAVKEHGKLDVLVNNAGIAGHSEAVADTTDEAWNRIFQVDIDGPMYAMRYAVREMLRSETGGNIVTIASVAGIKGCRGSVAYSSAKHALVGLCEHTAYAYMHKGIRSNIVCPGAIKTAMSSKPEQENAFGRGRIMSGMDPDLPFGTPEDIANAVLFLASEEAKFINGATLVVDGGVSCN